MCRKLRTTLPCTRQQLAPTLPDMSVFQARDARLKNRQKTNFDQRRGVRELSPLEPGDTVWLPDIEREAEVTAEVATHSYKVTSDNGSTRRNIGRILSMFHRGSKLAQIRGQTWTLKRKSIRPNDLHSPNDLHNPSDLRSPNNSYPIRPKRLVGVQRVRTQWVPFEPTW